MASRRDKSTKDRRKTNGCQNSKDSEGKMKEETWGFLQLGSYSIYDNINTVYTHVKTHRAIEH